MVEIKSDMLTVEVAEKGAELQSIKDCEGREYLWQGDPKFWPRRSPILFPTVCSVNDETYRVDGKAYHLPRHGFARDKVFTVISQSDSRVTLALHDSPETLEVYPYHFNLAVTYRLEGNRIHVIWHVENTDRQEIHFQIGGHPAFNIRNDSVKVHKSQTCRAMLMDVDGEPAVTVDYKTPVCAFWSPFDKHAPFVCIEPWYGIGDPRGFHGEFKDKPLMNHLQPGASFMSKYTITIG